MKAKGEVIHSILLNAQRLYQDAQLLHENNRYASAAELAALAIEEVGKALILVKRGEPRGKSDQEPKRAGITTQFRNDVAFDAVLDMPALRNTSLKSPKTATSSRPEITTSRANDEAVPDLMTWRPSFDRQDGVGYDDIRGDWQIKADLAGITSERADTYMQVAYSALQAVVPLTERSAGE